MKYAVNSVCYKRHSFEKLVFTHRMELVYANIVAKPKALVAPRARDDVRHAFKARLVGAHGVSVLVFVHVIVVDLVRPRAWIRRPIRTLLATADV